MQTKLCFKFARSIAVMAYGVIGNTAGFGPVVLGSSPSRPTFKSLDPKKVMGFFVFLDSTECLFDFSGTNFSDFLAQYA